VTRFLILSFLIFFSNVSSSKAEVLELFVDDSSGQVFVAPGSNRSSIGYFKKVAPSSNKRSHKVDEETIDKKASGKPQSSQKMAWYERFSVRGYSQLRGNWLMDSKDGEWFHPSDRSVREDQTFFLRRSRLVLSGYATDRLFIYLQPDLSSKPSDGDFSVQLRDLYGDYILDSDETLRLRFGQTIIPYGFSNLQSSSRRAPFERAEAINSGAEGERDNGVFFFFTPKEAQRRFKLLTQEHFKGSGDYGVFSFGLYTGQGLNRDDRNNELHSVARLAYPFRLESGQYIESNIAGYFGRYLPTVNSYSLDNQTVLIPDISEEGVVDKRIALSLIMHPDPFGFEAEWNVGQGPRLDPYKGIITSEFVRGGYVLLNYHIPTSIGRFLPFIRWQTYDGGRKFAINAPHVSVDEWDLGSEWEFASNLELTLQYSFTPSRTDSREFPYEELRDGHRIGAQIQLSY
jgi:hypothetical protein